MGTAHARLISDIGLGSKAPDAELTDARGSAVFISSFWDEQPLVLVLLDDLTSGPAAEHAIALRDAAVEFDQAGGEVVVVVNSTPGQVAGFASKHNIGFSILSDPERGAHSAYSASGGVASFVIDTSGVVRYAHRADNVLRAPSMFDLIDAVCGLTGEVVARPEIQAAPAPIALHGAAAGQPAFVNAVTANPAEGAVYACGKCGGSSYEMVTIATSGGWISRLFNYQYRKFIAIVCTTCNYAELYRAKASAAANVADILVGN